MDSSQTRAFDKLSSDQFTLPPGTNHLFVVGINAYQHVGKLTNARGDAEALVQMLQERYQFEPENITTLYDEQATHRNIMTQLRKKVTSLKPHDNLLIFFSGHGHFDPILEEGYWVPVDADYRAIDSYISYDFLQKIARAAKKAQHILFIIDSCYSGAVLVKSRDTTLSRLEKDPSRWIIASGRNEVVPDGAVGENSPFAGELLELLEKNADEGIHTLRLIDKLTENVSWNSHQTPIGQPLHGVGHKGGQFVFHPKRNEKRDWQEARETDTPQAYERYLKAWPEGSHADEAAWVLAQKRHTKRAYRRYLDRKGGVFRSEALTQLAGIEDKERFQRAKLRGEAALIQFCDLYPDSNFVEKAQEEIRRIRVQEREPEAWQLAQEEGSVHALQNYLDQFPLGAHTDEARRQLITLQAEQKRLAEKKAALEVEAQRLAEERARKQVEAQKKAEVEKKQQEAEQARQKQLAERKQQYEQWWQRAETAFQAGEYAPAQEAYKKALPLALEQETVKARIQQCQDEIFFEEAFARAQKAWQVDDKQLARKELLEALRYPSHSQADALAMWDEIKLPWWQQPMIRYGGLAILVLLLSWGGWRIFQGQGAGPSPSEERYHSLMEEANNTFAQGRRHREMGVVEHAQNLFVEAQKEMDTEAVREGLHAVEIWIRQYQDSLANLPFDPDRPREFPREDGPARLEALRVRGVEILEPWQEGIAIYREEREGREVMGLLNEHGEILGEAYEKVEELAQGFAVYHEGGKRGYLEARTGEVVIPARFEAAWPFDPEGVAKVREGGRIIFINTRGECVRGCEEEGIETGSQSIPQKEAKLEEKIETEPHSASPTEPRPAEIPIPEMVWVQGGEFDMGSQDGEGTELPIHRVKLSTFFIGKYEVTQREWQAVMGSNPSRYKCDDCPVDGVSWNEAQEYIRKLNKLTGESFRLPIEAEWEYAARGGQKRRGNAYAGSASLSSVGWYKDNCGKPHPVGQKHPNELGIYDMSGNIWEWCADWYGSSYYADCKSKGTLSNPIGPGTGVRRILRGGSFGNLAVHCQVDFRLRSTPNDKDEFKGFRLARSE
jgi:formylglycine-generating enzyme required for sulfatase activity